MNTPTHTQLLSPPAHLGLIITVVWQWVGGIVYLFSVPFGGKGVGCGILLVRALLLLSESQAGRLYAMTPAGSIGRYGDDGQ